MHCNQPLELGGNFSVVQKNTFLEVVAQDELREVAVPRGRSTRSEPSRSRETTPQPSKAQGECYSPELGMMQSSLNQAVWNPSFNGPCWTQQNQYCAQPMEWVPAGSNYDCGQPMFYAQQTQWVDCNGQPMQVTFVPYDQPGMYQEYDGCGRVHVDAGAPTATPCSTQNPSSAGSDTLENGDDARRWPRGDDMLLGEPRQYHDRPRMNRPDKDKKGDKKRKPRLHKSNGGKVFVGGLASKTTEETLVKIFSHFGEVAQANVLLDPASRRSRGFGYVCFVGDVPDGVSGCDHMIDGRMCGARLYKY